MIGQFRLTVTPSAATTAWKISFLPIGSVFRMPASPPIPWHQWL